MCLQVGESSYVPNLKQITPVNPGIRACKISLNFFLSSSFCALSKFISKVHFSSYWFWLELDKDLQIYDQQFAYKMVEGLSYQQGKSLKTSQPLLCWISRFSQQTWVWGYTFFSWILWQIMAFHAQIRYSNRYMWLLSWILTQISHSFIYTYVCIYIIL